MDTNLIIKKLLEEHNGFTHKKSKTETNSKSSMLTKIIYTYFLYQTVFKTVLFKPRISSSQANITNGVECVCESSFQGYSCQNTVQFCQSDPCYPENTEQCVDKIDINGESFYECSCLAGFTGNRCFTDINECESEPCLNDGNCIDGINGYKCECLEDEFEGELCEVAIGGFGPVIPGNGGSSSIVVLTVVGAIVGLLGIVGVGVVRVGKVESLKKDMKSRTKNSTKEHCGKGVRKIEKSGGSGGRGRKRKRKVRGAGKK